MSRCQQYELYAAESSVPDKGRTFASVDEIQSYLDSLAESSWWAESYPDVHTIEVGTHIPSDRQGSVGYLHPDGVGYVEMARCHWHENYVLHEIAHVMAESRFASNAHCPWFAKVYLDLVFLVRGFDAWTALRDAFSDAGIEVANVAPAHVVVAA